MFENQLAGYVCRHHLIEATMFVIIVGLIFSIIINFAMPFAASAVVIGGSAFILRICFALNDNIYKEFFDSVLNFFVAIPLAIFFLIVLPFVSIAIKLIDPAGPVFFKQVRVGKNGKKFEMLKFRSMLQYCVDKTTTTTKDDGRILPSIGKFMRLSKIDELPQIINVIRGDMAVIGPRPEQDENVRELVIREPEYAKRHAIRPGLTGWAQINGIYYEGLNSQLDKLEFDLFYVENRSLVLDVYIVVMTGIVILRKCGQ